MRETPNLLNVLTKYLSIPTYHALGERGKLTEALNVDFFDCNDLVVTKKSTKRRSRFQPGAKGITSPGRWSLVWTRFETSLMYHAYQPIGFRSCIRQHRWPTRLPGSKGAGRIRALALT